MSIRRNKFITLSDAFWREAEVPFFEEEKENDIAALAKMLRGEIDPSEQRLDFTEGVYGRWVEISDDASKDRWDLVKCDNGIHGRSGVSINGDVVTINVTNRAGVNVGKLNIPIEECSFIKLSLDPYGMYEAILQ